jgi:Spy/CpxP family protein refolding chaperone
VRGLSAQEVDDLLSGQGAGFARTAELNGYPGPRHTLDLADHLALDREQRARTEAIFAAMQADAKRLGAEIVDRERALAAAFAGQAISPHELAAGVDTLATLYGRLRARHLAAHLETTVLLTPRQIARYSEMRGYGGDTSHAH